VTLGSDALWIWWSTVCDTTALPQLTRIVGNGFVLSIPSILYFSWPVYDDNERFFCTHWSTNTRNWPCRSSVRCAFLPSRVCEKLEWVFGDPQCKLIRGACVQSVLYWKLYRTYWPRTCMRELVHVRYRSPRPVRTLPHSVPINHAVPINHKNACSKYYMRATFRKSFERRSISRSDKSS